MISRSADHRYSYCTVHEKDPCPLNCTSRVIYPGVTTILGMLDKSGPLMGWAARETATAAVRLVAELPAMLEATGEAGVVKMLSSRSTWQRDEAAQLGTEVHALADLVVRGEPTPSMTDTQRARVLHYAKWWKDSGWALRLSEAMVIRPRGNIDKGGHPAPGHGIPIADNEWMGWGGTFDLLAKDADGRTVLADVKTGKAIYREAVLQLAAYGMAAKVQPAGDSKTYTMPVPDRYVILHVTAEGVREVEVAVGTAERMAFLACLDLYHWSESMKGKKL